MRVCYCLLAAASLGLVGCSSAKLVGGDEVSVVTGADLPAPTRADFEAPPLPAMIGPLDKLSVVVVGMEDLSLEEVQADASGRILVPLAGEVEAAGRTPAELADIIAERLRAAHIRDPQVAVNLVEMVSQGVTVDGEVEEPGFYPVLGKMTLTRAIARARGTTEFARQSHVVIFREVDDQRMAALYDLRAIRQGIYADPQVYPNDLIMVGESEARRIFKDIIQGSSLITTPIFALAR